MNTDNLDNIWNTASHAGPSADEALELVQSERSRDRRRNIRMSLFGFNITLVTVLGFWGTVSGKSQLVESWPAMVALVALWATYVEFIRFRMAESTRYESMGKDLRSALRLTLEKAMASSREIKILLAVNILTVIPMTIASVQNLLGSDKMTVPQAWSFAIFCTLVFGANIAFLSFQTIARLRPRIGMLQQRIESLRD